MLTSKDLLDIRESILEFDQDPVDAIVDIFKDEQDQLVVQTRSNESVIQYVFSLDFGKCSKTLLSEELVEQKEDKACGEGFIADNLKCHAKHAAEHIGENVVAWKTGKVVGGALTAIATSHGLDHETSKLVSEAGIQALAATALFVRKKENHSVGAIVQKFLSEVAGATIGKIAHTEVEDALTGGNIYVQTLGAAVAGKGGGAITTTTAAAALKAQGETIRDMFKRSGDMRTDAATGKFELTQKEKDAIFDLSFAGYLLAISQSGDRADAGEKCGAGWIAESKECRIKSGNAKVIFSEGSKADPVKRSQLVEALAQELENGKFSYNPDEPRRTRFGKSGALTALRGAKDPRIGLIVSTNDKGKPTGFMSFKPGARSITIQTLGTDQTTKGSGRAMFEQIIEVAKRLGKGIEVTAEGDANGFYEKMGMKRVSESDFELSSEDVKTWKSKRSDTDDWLDGGDPGRHEVFIFEPEDRADAGEKCGAGWIAESKECRIGKAASSASSKTTKLEPRTVEILTQLKAVMRGEAEAPDQPLPEFRKPASVKPGKFTVSEGLSSAERKELAGWSQLTKNLIKSKDSRIPEDIKERLYELVEVIGGLVSDSTIATKFITIKDSEGRIQAATSLYATKMTELVAKERGVPPSVEVGWLGSAPWNVLGNNNRAVKGAGTAAIKAAVQYSMDQGYGGAIKLDAAREAVGFYKKLGFEQDPGAYHKRALWLPPEKAQKLLAKTDSLDDRLDASDSELLDAEDQTFGMFTSPLNPYLLKISKEMVDGVEAVVSIEDTSNGIKWIAVTSNLIYELSWNSKNNQLKVEKVDPGNRTDSVDRMKRLVRIEGVPIEVTHEPGDRRFETALPMTAHYGRVRGTWGMAEDGKAIDIYLGTHPESTELYKIIQIDPDTGEPDETKYLTNYESRDEARRSFVRHAGEDRFGYISACQWDELHGKLLRNDEAELHEDWFGRNKKSTQPSEKKGQPCGEGWISAGDKCTKGTSEPTPQKPQKMAALPKGVNKRDTPNMRVYSFDVGDKSVEMTIDTFRKYAGIEFMVGDEYDRGQLKGRDANRAALTLAKVFQHDVSTRPDGFVYKMKAWTDDGYGQDRADGYEKMGFSKPANGKPGGDQYGIVKNGKLMPYAP